MSGPPLVDLLWAPLILALLGGVCAGAWVTALWYELRMGREVTRRTTRAVAAWREHLGTSCPRCVRDDGYRRLLRAVRQVDRDDGGE